jgi:hypothetical protein
MPGPTYDESGLTYDGLLNYLGDPFVPVDLAPILPAVFVQVAFANNPLDTNPTWSTLPGVLEVETHRGRAHELARFSAGELQVKLSNRDRRYDPLWTGGPYGANLQPLKPVRVLGGYNLLTPNQSSLDWDQNTDDWLQGANTTIEATTEHTALDGSWTLKMTAVAGGDIYAACLFDGVGSPFAAGVPFTAMGSFLAKTTGRTVKLNVTFYDAANVSISQVETSAVDSSSAWTTVVVNGVAPPGTAIAVVRPYVLGAGAGESHYCDALALFCGTDPNPTWCRGSLDTIFTGFVESWTADMAGVTSSETTLVAYDLFKFLSYKKLRSKSHRDAVAALSPSSYWRLSDAVSPGHSGGVQNGVIVDTQGRAPGSVDQTIVPQVASPLVTDSDAGMEFSADKGYVFIPNAMVRPGANTAFAIGCWMKTTAKGINVPDPRLGTIASGAPVIMGCNLPSGTTATGIT